MKEHDIRPQALIDRYLELSAEDAEQCFGTGARDTVPCVACGSDHCDPAFVKSGFAYALCRACGTLFQSPRPSIAAFEAFYRESKSSRYWADVFFPAVAEIRREAIFRPRVERLAALCAEKRITVDRLIDVGAGYGIFLDEWRRVAPATHGLAIEPSASLAEACRQKGFPVVEDIVENVAGHDNSADLIVCFEVLEHVYDPLSFVRTLMRLARPGGYVFVSTLGIDGFDMQVLWERASQISPPHHINFLSSRGFERLFMRAGLTGTTITTPGRLDVDIVRNAARRDPRLLEGHRFLRHLLENDERAASFQQFLSREGLSSHVWVIGQKPGGVDGAAAC